MEWKETKRKKRKGERAKGKSPTENEVDAKWRWKMALARQRHDATCAYHQMDDMLCSQLHFIPSFSCHFSAHNDFGILVLIAYWLCNVNGSIAVSFKATAKHIYWTKKKSYDFFIFCVYCLVHNVYYVFFCLWLLTVTQIQCSSKPPFNFSQSNYISMSYFISFYVVHLLCFCFCFSFVTATTFSISRWKFRQSWHATGFTLSHLVFT